MSRKNSVNLEDAKRVARTTLIWYTPVVLLFLDQIQKGQFDSKILYALAISTTVDVVRRYLAENTSAKP